MAVIQRKILLVDDEIQILQMFEEALTLQNCNVRTAQDAESALKILDSEKIMVMFLDLKLPGMSGIELCKKIRENNQIAIIHALTGYSNYFGLRECRMAGFDDFFIKPVRLETMYKAVTDALEKMERWNAFG